jgi:hypothetical protein
VRLGAWAAAAILAAACAPQNLLCQPELDASDCEPAAWAAVSGAPVAVGSVAAIEVCSVDLATLCQLHGRPTDVVLTLPDGRLVGVSLTRRADGTIDATAYWNEDGRID